MGGDPIPGPNMEFKCVRCGHCCKKIRGPQMGQIHGLMILPEEVGLFPSGLVRPMIRYTHNAESNPGQVWMYQVDAEICPHYDEKEGCLIYDKRPVVCVCYPFELSASKLVIHGACPEAQRMRKAGIKLKVPESYKEPLLKVCRYYGSHLNTLEFERLDLEEGRWRYFTEGLTKEHLRLLGRR